MEYRRRIVEDGPPGELIEGTGDGTPPCTGPRSSLWP